MKELNDTTRLDWIESSQCIIGYNVECCGWGFDYDSPFYDAIRECIDSAMLCEGMKCFLKLVKLIALDNDITMISNDFYKWCKDIRWSLIEAQAAKLSQEDAEIFCNGEVTESRQIMERYHLWELHSILERVFDGDLTDDFYEKR